MDSLRSRRRRWIPCNPPVIWSQSTISLQHTSKRKIGSKALHPQLLRVWELRKKSPYTIYVRLIIETSLAVFVQLCARSYFIRQAQVHNGCACKSPPNSAIIPNCETKNRQQHTHTNEKGKMYIFQHIYLLYLH